RQCQQQRRRHLFQQTDPLYHPSSRWSEARLCAGAAENLQHENKKARLRSRAQICGSDQEGSAPLLSRRVAFERKRVGMRIILIFLLLCTPALAHDPSHPELNEWFDRLASGKGLCCSFADGLVVSDVDW